MVSATSRSNNHERTRKEESCFFGIERKAAYVGGAVLVLLMLFLLISATALGVRYTYTLRSVAFGGALLGAVTGFLGSFAVLRKQSLLGDAISHAALPGVALAFLIAGRETGALLIGAGLASWLGVGFIRLVTRTTRIKDDAAMGIVLAGWFAAGIVGLTYIQGRSDASQAGLDTFIFGQAASIVRSDIRLLLGVSAAAVGVAVMFWKQFKLVTFNPEFAGANGFNVSFWQGLLSGLVVVAIVLGLQLAGVILMVGMLIAPGIAARQWSDRLGGMVALAALFGATSGIIGAVLSAADADLPTGPMIIVVASVLVVVSITIAPGRGVLWLLLGRRRDARRFALRTVLTDVYHYAYDHGGPKSGVPERFVVGVRRRSGRRALQKLLARGFLRREEGAKEGDEHETFWYLQESGLSLARADARNQRLWDLYRQLGDQLGLPPFPEERERDIRAVLPEESVTALEAFLGDKGEEPRVRR
ncbi:MAG: metal ABC transporter permease [Alkalispirochaetaceae bacterium]